MPHSSCYAVLYVTIFPLPLFLMTTNLLECTAFMCPLHFLTSHSLINPLWAGFLLITLLKLLLSRSPTISILPKISQLSILILFNLFKKQKQNKQPKNKNKKTSSLLKSHSSLGFEVPYYPGFSSTSLATSLESSLLVLLSLLTLVPPGFVFDLPL